MGTTVNLRDKIVEACYRYDGDEARNSTRYFAPPEDYVDITLKYLAEYIRLISNTEPSRPESEKATKLQ